MAEFNYTVIKAQQIWNTIKEKMQNKSIYLILRFIYILLRINILTWDKKIHL